ncbi:MAG: DUF4254 domain-containing protein [Flavobacteriaceae bacterium]|nr:DUF4254 domain-containing protein [Flavobacteriaceae bacterium]
MTSAQAFNIFEQSIRTYHVLDSVDQAFENPFDAKTLEHLLYRKNWIDTVQWHYEDLIREPSIDPVDAVALKRKIDASNQDRTDMVEYIDSYFLKHFEDVTPLTDATINTESPAWAIDRLSILALKIYHMNEEATRPSASDAHRAACATKLAVLQEQKIDLSTAIDQLLADMAAGKKYMKEYKQMKMYNDESLNPVLYKKNS